MSNEYNIIKNFYVTYLKNKNYPECFLYDEAIFREKASQLETRINEVKSDPNDANMVGGFLFPDIFIQSLIDKNTPRNIQMRNLALELGPNYWSDCTSEDLLAVKQKHDQELALRLQMPKNDFK